MDSPISLQALQQRLVQQLPEESRAFARLARACLIGDDISREARQISETLHRLGGRCSQLGYDTLGRKLILMECQLEQAETPSPKLLAAIANTASDAIDESLLTGRARNPVLKAPSRYKRLEVSAGKSALVVEDDIELGPLARSALSDMGFDAVRLAHSAEQGLDECRILFPDIIVCDWRLRAATGLDLLKTIRLGGVPGLEATPFIMLTSQNDKTSVQKALREGADDFIVKPFAIGRLRAAVERLLVDPGSMPDARDGPQSETKTHTEQEDNDTLEL